MVEQKHEATAGHEDDFLRGESHLAGRFQVSASTTSLVLQEPKQAFILEQHVQATMRD